MSARVSHQYKRRTLDEALELAKAAFRSAVADNLTPAEIEEIREHATITSGTFGEEWTAILGAAPDRNSFYGVEIYRRSDQCPYVEKVFVRMLVPRDRSTDTVRFIWRPVLPPYTGSYFE